MNMQAEVGREVYTPLGKGKVVYLLPDGTFLVEFPWGGGRMFLPGELNLQMRRLMGESNGREIRSDPRQH